MFNFIGTAPDTVVLAAIPGLHVHHYGKTPKPQRKVGHATLTAETGDALQERRTRLEAAMAATSE
jgi:5-(carboxyamino)imidazole ribonucleotide synthase